MTMVTGYDGGLLVLVAVLLMLAVGLSGALLVAVRTGRHTGTDGGPRTATDVHRSR